MSNDPNAVPNDDPDNEKSGEYNPSGGVPGHYADPSTGDDKPDTETTTEDDDESA